jgi:hypothetical protein
MASLSASIGRTGLHASRLRILEGLRDMTIEMRKLQAHMNGDRICSVTGGSLYDTRLPTITRRVGPSSGIQDFHHYLRNGLHLHFNEGVTKLISMHQQHWDAPTFTHGDLSSLNILARGDEIVGIIDGETAGWYPSYWEYATACHVNPQILFWSDEIDKFLEPLPEALEMEHLRQRYFGDYQAYDALSSRVFHPNHVKRWQSYGSLLARAFKDETQ